MPGTGEYEWDGFRSHTDLPHEFNPARGWIATANHDIQSTGYDPPIMFRSGPSLRYDRLYQIFSKATDISVEDMERMQHDAVHPYVVDDRPLWTGWTAQDATVEWARTQFLQWDGVYDKDGVGGRSTTSGPATWTRRRGAPAPIARESSRSPRRR